MTPLFDIVYEGTWFTVNRLPREGKRNTECYEVLTKDCETIAHVRWYGRWRKYALFPEDGIVMEEKCLMEIAFFLRQCMRQRVASKGAP